MLLKVETIEALKSECMNFFTDYIISEYNQIKENLS